MTQQTKSFLRRRQKIADRLFELTRDLEELEDAAEEFWQGAEDDEDEEFWLTMKDELEDQVSRLDDIYSELDESEDE